VGVVLFVETEAIETVSAFMTLHLLLKMQRLETTFHSLAGTARLIANCVFFALKPGFKARDVAVPSVNDV
jgi:hypothetical protein